MGDRRGEIIAELISPDKGSPGDNTSALLKLTDGIQPTVRESAVMVAWIGRTARRGNRIGVIFMLGDLLNLPKGSKQLVPNPFQWPEKANRMLTNPDNHDALLELSKLDGAFVLRGDGL